MQAQRISLYIRIHALTRGLYKYAIYMLAQQMRARTQAHMRSHRDAHTKALTVTTTAHARTHLCLDKHAGRHTCRRSEVRMTQTGRQRNGRTGELTDGRTDRQTDMQTRMFTITKTRLFKYIENFTSKNWKFSDKISDIFHISAQSIDCCTR